MIEEIKLALKFIFEDYPIIGCSILLFWFFDFMGSLGSVISFEEEKNKKTEKELEKEFWDDILNDEEEK